MREKQPSRNFTDKFAKYKFQVREMIHRKRDSDFTKTPLAFAFIQGPTYETTNWSTVWVCGGASGMDRRQCIVQIAIFAEGEPRVKLLPMFTCQHSHVSTHVSTHMSALTCQHTHVSTHMSAHTCQHTHISAHTYQHSHYHMPCLVAIVDCTHVGSATSGFKDLVTVDRRSNCYILHWAWWQFPPSRNFSKWTTDLNTLYPILIEVIKQHICKVDWIVHKHCYLCLFSAIKKRNILWSLLVLMFYMNGTIVRKLCSWKTET